MKKLNVTVKILYNYTVELPKNEKLEEITTEILDYCDEKDPAFEEICKILHKYNLSFNSYLEEVFDTETGKDYFLE